MGKKAETKIAYMG